MARQRLPLVVLLGAVAALLAVGALWWAQDNPGIDGTTRGDDYMCSAPYDTVLNDADNVPGGEPPSDSDSIADRCAAAGEARFTQAAALGGAALLLAASVAVLRGKR